MLEGVHVEPAPTLPEHVYAMRYEAELAAIEPAHEPKKATRSRKAAA